MVKAQWLSETMASVRAAKNDNELCQAIMKICREERHSCAAILDAVIAERPDLAPKAGDLLRGMSA